MHQLHVSSLSSLKSTLNGALKPVSLILKACQCLVAPQRREVHLNSSGMKSKLAKIFDIVFTSCSQPAPYLMHFMQCLLLCCLLYPDVFEHYAITKKKLTFITKR